ncbi:hypothetical protein J3Q64DRAFT_1695139 [Phycomyces blakesleeanus]|uniref:Uncharacterized protein n=2 Tax=Phycomyces blakesleeanus TaxID=4837 RepID=A0A162ZIA7_PHYB8|nr:hypothetical protein PHYBLDRAFT_151920 [Phycomyces blakesleeanus NRRL 1555(-)]OAD66981.1 hypothetical protein PHYBLDRAFT_151920 [Phycomyces blakesleeanus NRRL 1555(-)]|eukprot:XP_018285021.1 hypothetical protein PHYBLDRAFT_151920 [Phycomyces blakesleeanus NRRL 1555(-)]
MTQLASMYCKVGQLMDGQKRNIGAAAWQESMPASLPALFSLSPSPVPAMSEQEMSSVILILAHHTHTYLTNWRLIDNEMGLEVELLSEMSFLHLLQKDVMLDGESDVKDMNIATVHVLRVKHPS